MNNEDERMSKSKKRRQRRRNNLLNRSISEEDQSIEINTVVEENVAEDKEEQTEKFEETTNQRIEVLKLKRVEHKYKVESPKEVKVEHVKSSDKKLKAKSKSLDDDEILRIQELSEASESEDPKPQSNILISEASSEENLGDSDCDLQQKKRRALDSISLQLNEDNQIEALSHISPAEEQALRTFLGGLNLVESPEESAKDLLDRTASATDQKAKKQQKRKELEEYFLPIAENPRFLDAISEEASDISDKEAPSSSKGVHHIKQCTPEQDLRQIPPPIPPRANRRNKLGKYGNQVEQPGAVLVETKLFTPEGVQGTVCSSQVVASSEEKAEVVYLNDSSESSTSSGDFEEAFSELQEENACPETNNEPTKNSCHNGQNVVEETKGSHPDHHDQPKDSFELTSEFKNSNDIQVESNESLTTTFSSHTSASTRINKFSDNDAFFSTSAMLSQLTPPPTPDDVTAQTSKQGCNGVLFDYTKIPNILSSKEPENSCRDLTRNGSDKNKSESLLDVDSVILGERGGGGGGADIKNYNFAVKNTDINHVAAVHMTQRSVNGQLDNRELRKVLVDEVFRDGNMEKVRKDVEVFKSKQNESDLTKDQDQFEMSKEKPRVAVETCIKETKSEKREGSEKASLTKDAVKKLDKGNSPFKSSIQETVDVSDVNNCEAKHTEIRNMSSTHVSKKNVKENTEVKILTLDKVCENKVKQTNEDFEEYKISGNNEISKVDYDGTKDKESKCDMNKSDVHNKDLNEKKLLLESLTPEYKSDFITKSVKIGDKVGAPSYIHQTMQNNIVKETVGENLLRHVIMTSSDSNKTDSQKLNDFKNIRLLNSELKDKISKKELIGPAFKTPTSPSVLNEDTGCMVVMYCEELPAKTFVQRRVKEFSEECHDIELANQESVLKQFIINNEISNQGDESLVNKDFIKSRVKTFLHKEEKVLDDTDKGSILKQIILANDAKIIEKDKSVTTEKVEQPDINKNHQENLTNETIIPVNVEDHYKKFRPTDKEKEIVIPIIVEKTKTDKQVDVKKVYSEAVKTLEQTISHQNDEKVFENKVVPILSSSRQDKDKDTDSVLKRLILSNNIDKCNSNVTEKEENKQKVDVEQKETFIPIAIEKPPQGNLDDKIIILEKEKKIENKETIIPITIEKLNANKNTLSDLKTETINIIKKEQHKQDDKIEHKETIIPIACEELNLDKYTQRDLKNKKPHIIKKEENKQEEKIVQQETIIPIIIDKIKVTKNTQGNLKSNTINTVETKINRQEEEIDQKETIIPIAIEKLNVTENMEKDLKNKELNIIEKEENKQRDLKNITISTLETEINKQEEKIKQKETIIPIVIEKINVNKNTQIGLKNKKINIIEKEENKLEEKNVQKETIIPIVIEKINGNNNTQRGLKNKKISIIEKDENKAEEKIGHKETIIPIAIEKLNMDKNTLADLKNQRIGIKKQEEKIKQKETIIPIAIENYQGDLKNEKIIPIKVKDNVNNLKATDLVEEKVPIPIKRIHINDNVEKTSSEKMYKEVSKSLEHIVLNKTEEENVYKTHHQNILETRKEKISDSREKIIPIKIETKNLESTTKKNISNNKKDATNLTMVNLKEVNDCLKNIVENKSEGKNKQETEEENRKKVSIVPINIEKRDAPPIPPPRRSKKNVTRKEYENINITQNVRESTQPKEIDKKDTNEKIPVSNDITYTNVLSPPRPASVGSDSTDSEESSRCTAKYNPNSSIADVTSITKEEENGETKQVYQPQSLRSIVLTLFMSLPFGEEILKELADVSKNIDYFTNKIPFRGFSATNTDKNDDILAKQKENMPGQWYTQKDVVRNQYGDERRKILELHEKFLTRRSYSEGDSGSSRSNDDDRVVITGIGSREADVMSPNRLLTIIREEPNESDNANNNVFFDDNADQRLKAKNLGEWLILARHKSKSTSNLDCTNIPINNLRKTFINAQPETAKFSNTRRRSLPQEIYEKQLIDIMEKEREIQRELEMLEEEKRKIRAEIAPSKQKEFQADDFFVSKQGDFAEMRENVDRGPRPMSMPAFPTEFFRQQMYDEYMDKFSEREERKQQKVIKISSSNDLPQEPLKKEIVHPIEIEQEFMDKVKQKLGQNYQNLDDNSSQTSTQLPSESSIQQTSLDNPPVVVLDGDKVKGVETLPKHLQEFVDDLTALPEDSIWSPGQPRNPQTSPSKSLQRTESQNSQSQGDEPLSPIWTPKSATTSPTVERKEFRTVSFQSPVLSRKNRTNSETFRTADSTASEPPWRLPEGSSDTAINLSSTLDRRLPTSQSSPGFGNFSTSPRLPKAQNPTITLLQKAREGQLPRGAHYIDQDRRPPNDRPPIKYPGEVLYHIKNEYTSESDTERPRKMADLGPRKFEGIGPTSKDGMPLILRSEVKDKDQSKWYKRMYDTIHKQKPHRDEFVTVRYKQKRAQYPYTSGYLSEPEPGAYDSDFTDYKYQTLDRRRIPQTQQYINNSSTMPRNVPDKSYSSSDIIRNTQETYQPGRIENYMPGRSSISEKEAKQWWDEVMDIFDGHLQQQNRVPPQKPKSFINQALKESGYESDSTLIFRRKEDTANQISPKEQRQAYKVIQQGGDVPFQGLRKPAPERPKEPDLPPPPPPPKSQGGVRSQDQESPRKYVENEVTIHYKTPVRTEIKEHVSEDELAHRQAEAMKKIYEEERKRKYFQELQDMKSRRHTDNFIPSQKSPISLNRYDDFDDLNAPTKTRPRSPEPRLVARALYNFVGQTARELTFRKGDLIYVRRQVDKNWYEGELNAMVGLFPVNYVEIVPYEGPKTTTRKAHEGQARARYNFLAQTHLELSLAKGELVTITRRVDDNWFEGKIGGRKGIFPVAYVEVLIDPSDPPPPSTKPVASPAAHSLLLNGSAQGKDSMGSHLYTPTVPNPISTRDTGYHHAKPVQLTGSGTYSTLPKASTSPIDQALHIETHSDPVPYRALYRYNPQNDDELELLEGDTVFVLEKCDDGWYVGSSDRTGAFGTFPGNYVEKI